MASFLQVFGLVRRARVARQVTVTMMTVLATAFPGTGCPVPTQFDEAPETPNYPPVVDIIRSTPYQDGGTVIVGQRPTLTIYVDEKNLGNTLEVRVIKDLHLAFADPNSSLQFLLQDVFITASDLPPPEDEEPPSVRKKQFELQTSPCPTGSEGTKPVLTVCVSDRGYAASNDSRDPCIPGSAYADDPVERGYVSRYTIVITCSSD